MRAYYWGNMYLASIQQGIQAVHCTSELYLKYPFDEMAQSTDLHQVKMSLLHQWGQDHKTVIILNGGESEGLIEIAAQLNVDENPYPWVTWSESVTALNSALTCVGIIVDEKIVAAVHELRQSKRERRRVKFETRLDDFEFELVKLIFYSVMAR